GAPRDVRARRCSRGRRRCSGSRDRGARRRSSRGALPVGPDEAAVRDDLPQGEHGRVGGEDDELSAGRYELEAAVECALERRYDVDGAGVESAVLEAKGELGGTVARCNQPLEATEQRLEVDVPDP